MWFSSSQAVSLPEGNHYYITLVWSSTTSIIVRLSLSSYYYLLSYYSPILILITKSMLPLLTLVLSITNSIFLIIIIRSLLLLSSMLPLQATTSTSIPSKIDQEKSRSSRSPHGISQRFDLKSWFDPGTQAYHPR